MQSMAPSPCFFIICARALDAIFAQPVPVDPLLPIETDDAEICCAHGVLPTGALTAPLFVDSRRCYADGSLKEII